MVRKMCYPPAPPTSQVIAPRNNHFSASIFGSAIKEEQIGRPFCVILKRNHGFESKPYCGSIKMAVVRSLSMLGLAFTSQSAGYKLSDLVLECKTSLFSHLGDARILDRNKTLMP